MVKKAGHALVVGGAALYVSEAVCDTDMFKKATDDNTRMLYKYGGAALGALIGAFAWHAVAGG